MSYCYFCGSDDAMTPFRRPDRMPLLSWIFPTLRWRYCRTCTRHFLGFHRERPAMPATPIVRDDRARGRRRRVA